MNQDEITLAILQTMLSAERGFLKCLTGDLPDTFMHRGVIQSKIIFIEDQIASIQYAIKERDGNVSGDEKISPNKLNG